MKLIAHALFAVLLVAAFLFAAHFEQDLPGDQVWLIYFGIVLTSSFLVFFVTRSWGTILIIAALSPLSSPGMFFLVNIFLSAKTAAAGLGLAAVSEQAWCFLKSRAS